MPSLEDLTGLREFLEPRWLAYKRYWGMSQCSLSSGMCLHTSVFLTLLYPNLRLAGGGITERSQGGFFDGSEIHPHYWATDGAAIIDLTADQFGHWNEVEIIQERPARYLPTYRDHELAERRSEVLPAARRWIRRVRQEGWAS